MTTFAEIEYISVYDLNDSQNEMFRITEEADIQKIYNIITGMERICLLDYSDEPLLNTAEIQEREEYLEKNDITDGNGCGVDIHLISGEEIALIYNGIYGCFLEYGSVIYYPVSAESQNWLIEILGLVAYE